MLSASSRGHGHEHSGVPTELNLFDPCDPSDPWPQTNLGTWHEHGMNTAHERKAPSSRRAAIWSFESCISCCWDLVSWRDEPGNISRQGALSVFWKQRKYEEYENHNQMKSSIIYLWMQPTTMHCKIFQTTISHWCSINVPFKVASLTSAWKASESFSAAKNGSTSTPKHNFSAVSVPKQADRGSLCLKGLFLIPTKRKQSAFRRPENH